MTVLKATVLRKTTWIIDWHNTGTSLIGLRLGQDHLGTRLSAWWERSFVQGADVHLCVTEALAAFVSSILATSGSRAPVIVLYDRAQESFHRLELAERKAFLGRELPDRYAGFEFAAKEEEEKQGKEEIFWMVTGTSWTPDENFNVLVEALTCLDALAWEKNHGRPLPFTIAMVITGKGPLRQHYMEDVIARESRKWKNRIIVRDVWLRMEDYPRLLGSCHLGISLHQSSSGLDLPMKIVDMFGCGLACCAINFACLQELVRPHVNGLVFETAEQLAHQIYSLIEGQTPAKLDSNGDSKWRRLMKGAAEWKEENGSFAKHWKERVYPFFQIIGSNK